MAETVAAIDALETGADVRTGYLDGPDGDPAALGAVLAVLAGSSGRDGEQGEDEKDGHAGAKGEDGEDTKDGPAGGDGGGGGGTMVTPSAVVIPMVTGPHPSVEAIRRTVAASPGGAVVAEPLGPHPLLAEVLHVRLAEAGLARVDRIRLVGITTAADGIVLATVGGEEGARAADATGVLLAARLAVPVVSAALDGTPGVRAASERLRLIGASRLALVPYLVGPEVDDAQLAASAAEIDAESAQPLGAHPAIAQLIIDRYTDALVAASTRSDPGTGR